MTSPFSLKTRAPCPRPLIHESTKKKKPDFLKLELSDASLKNDVFFLCGMLWHLIQFFIRAPGWGAWSPFFVSLSFSIKFSMKRMSRSDRASRRTHAGIGCWWTARRISRSRACCCRCRCSRTTATGWGLATARSWASSLYLQGARRRVAQAAAAAAPQVVTVQTFLVVQCVFAELSLTVED